MKYVVVLIHEMGKEAMATSPTMIAFGETNLTYAKISFTTVSIAEFIRSLGFHAIPSANCTALNIPLAIDAGLGQLGRNAKLINPLFGPRCRISKVITDLPLAVNKPIFFGVTEFCNQCKKCARQCPVGAIPFGDRSFEPIDECSHQGVLQWQMDHKKCRQFWAEVGTNCGICIRACPFNKGRARIHDVTRWIIKNFKFIDPLILKLDEIMGYGKYQPAEKFWHKV
jgi:reductive dehalogenase